MNDFRSVVGGMFESRMGQVGAGAVAVAGAVAASYLLKPGHKPVVPVVDPHKQSLDIGDGVRVSPLQSECEGGELLQSLTSDYGKMDTLYTIFMSGLSTSRHDKCLGTRTGQNREYEFLTYQQVYDRARAFGSGLIKLGLCPCPETFIGIYCKNRPEWVITEQACNTYSMVLVPLYDTLGPTACQYVINHMEIQTIVCDQSEKAKNLLQSAKDTPSLKTIIVIDDVTSDVTSLAQASGVQVLLYADVEKSSDGKLEIPVPPKPSDLATVCFTSGTTGDPKGVMVTHGNFAAQLAGLLYPVQTKNLLSKDDCHLSYLPLAHLFERIIQMVIFSLGGYIGFFSGEITLLLDDLQALRPTLFPTVPRLLNRVRDKVYAGVKNSWIKSQLLEWALAGKAAEVERGIVRRDSIWDTLVFSKLQAMYGGRVKIMVTGSAPLPTETMKFFKCAMGCLVLEGYGQTEAVAAVSLTYPGETSIGHVGTPVMCNYLKVVDVPEMNYYASDNKGEICVYGPNVTPGYYKNPEKTAEAIDKDGWLHTGDIGMWLPNGALKIIDRRKHIFKLAQGEYIAPEKIEAVYATSQFVAQIFVDGDSLKTSCMAVVVPDAEVMETWAPKNGFPTDMTRLCQTEEVKNVILKDMLDRGKKAGLKGFEQVKDIALHPDPFSLQNGLLTPTFKGKRPQLRQKFKSVMEKLYEKNNM